MLFEEHKSRLGKTSNDFIGNFIGSFNSQELPHWDYRNSDKCPSDTINLCLDAARKEDKYYILLFS